MNWPRLAAEVDSILKYSAVASTMTPGASRLLEEVKRKADAGSAANARTQPERPPVPGMVPVRTKDGWVWRVADSTTSATEGRP